MSKVRAEIPQSELRRFKRWVDSLGTKVTNESRTMLYAALRSIEFKAIMFAPVDYGLLRSSIRHKMDMGKLSGLVMANKLYAPYVEFGTGSRVNIPQDVFNYGITQDYLQSIRGRGIRKRNHGPDPYLFPATRLAVKDMEAKLLKMGFKKQ